MERVLQPGRGAPASLQLEQLAPFNENTDPGVKYFSGVATYTKSFALPGDAKLRGNLLLDLGQVGDVAEVRVNGALAGTVWREPYRIDIGKYVKQGKNELDIRVANLWVNRLIGDAQPGAKKITWTAIPTYTAKAPLRASGLLGPCNCSIDSEGRAYVARLSDARERRDKSAGGLLLVAPLFRQIAGCHTCFSGRRTTRPSRLSVIFI